MKKTEQKVLLQLARATIVAQVHGQSLPVLEKPSETLLSHSGCFVTIKQQGQLRGCIGSFVAAPLWETVREMAVLGCYRDPRFYPMRPADLADFQLEEFRYTRRYSWFSPLKRFRSADMASTDTKRTCPHWCAACPRWPPEYGWIGRPSCAIPA